MTPQLKYDKDKMKEYIIKSFSSVIKSEDKHFTLSEDF